MALSREQCEQIGMLLEKLGIKASVSYDQTKGACNVTIEDITAMVDKILLREGIKAELDAATMYEKSALMATDPLVKAVFLDIAAEEKTHVGEFLYLLQSLDREQAEKLKKGAEEVEEIRKKIQR